MRTPVLKVDVEKRLVYGEVYAPDLPDTDGDFMTAEHIEKMAHGFMKRFGQANIDSQHDRDANGSVVVESFIARKGDTTFIPGAWVVGVFVEDEAVWAGVVSGEFNGFSMDAMVQKRPVEVEMEIPEFVEGQTQVRKGHKHNFVIKFDDDGNFAGGETDEVEDENGVVHKHDCRRGTLTELAAGHDHAYSYMEHLIRE